MKKVILTLFGIAVLGVSCKKDDDHEVEPPRKRAEEAIAAQNEIEEFLSNYAYNYEEFENPSEDFDYRVVIDSIERSEEHTSELQSRGHLVCRLLLEKKNKTNRQHPQLVADIDRGGAKLSEGWTVS